MKATTMTAERMPPAARSRGAIVDRRTNDRAGVTAVQAGAAAATAGLRYIADDAPGIVRRRVGDGFRYTTPAGRTVRDRRTLARIAALAIPPAWTDVWISPVADGHLQATGRDARGRKQYRYHADWTAMRDVEKYDRLLKFGKSLPRIRARLRRDLRRPGLVREKVLATIVRLMDRTGLRVGNDEYARTNGSYGLTTLRDRHVDVRGDSIRLRFSGKSGVPCRTQVADARLARLVRRCRDLPGKELFQFVDERGKRRDVGSADVNRYLREIAGYDFTAKDFRTWSGTLCAVRCLDRLDAPRSSSEARKQTAEVVREVAERLGNTAAVCRKSYIHPHVLRALTDVELRKRIARTGGVGTRRAAPAEERLLRFMRSQAPS